MLHPDPTCALSFVLAAGLLLPQDGAAPPAVAPADAAPQAAVEPATPEAAAKSLARVPAPPGSFEERWEAALTDADLERRERAFAEAVAVARVNPHAIAWFTERARDARRPELAWTARLALRELRGDVWRIASGSNAPLRVEVERLQAETRVRRALEARESALRRLTLERVPAGGYRIVLVEEEEGGEQQHVFEAPSLEELLAERSDVALELRFLMGAQAAAPQEPRTDRLGVWVLAPRDDVFVQRAVPAGVGQLVVDVEPGSIAHMIGLGRGDLVVRINERRIDHGEAISEALAERPEESAVRVEWVDPDGERCVRVWRPTPNPRANAPEPVAEPVPSAAPERAPSTAPAALPAEAPGPPEKTEPAENSEPTDAPAPPGGGA